MIYTLYIWTIVAMSGNGCHNCQVKEYDWRPIGEYHQFAGVSPKDKCEQAAKELDLKAERYRCVRSK